MSKPILWRGSMAKPQGRLYFEITVQCAVWQTLALFGDKPQIKGSLVLENVC